MSALMTISDQERIIQDIISLLKAKIVGDIEILPYVKSNSFDQAYIVKIHNFGVG